MVYMGLIGIQFMAGNKNRSQLGNQLHIVYSKTKIVWSVSPLFSRIFMETGKKTSLINDEAKKYCCYFQ